MANGHGDWIWYELMTTDADAATAFYEPVLGWTVGAPMTSEFDYRAITASEGMVGGVLALTPEMTDGGARPCWVGYLAVDDCDRMVASVEADGGRVLMPARDMEGVGRIAMVTDPQGAPLYVMKPAMPADAADRTSNAFAADRPMDGHCAWNELITSNKDAAWHFYTKHFGWVKDGAMDMGPMGSYDFIRHKAMLGAMMTGTAEMGPPHWNFYFRVPEIEAARAMVESSGGQVINGPQEVPGGDFIINGIDPQGAHFALVGKRV